MLKIFIYKILIFLFFTLGLIITVFFVFYAIERMQEKRNAYDFTFLGHSHVACSVNPEIISSGYHKVLVKGVNAQSLFWTIKSAEKLLKKNDVERLFISYTNNSLTTDRWTYDDNKLMQANSLYQLSATDMKFFFEKKTTKFLKYILTLPLPFGKIHGQFNPATGSYINLDRENKGKRIHVQHHLLSQYKDLYGYKNLFQFCLKHPKLKIILIRYPLSDVYFELLGQNANEELFKSSVRELLTLPNVIWKDYAHVITKDTLFYNVDHLNRVGADMFSKRLVAEINEKSYFFTSSKL